MTTNLIWAAICAVVMAAAGYLAWRERDMAKRLALSRDNERFANQYAENMLAAFNDLRAAMNQKPEQLPARIRDGLAQQDNDE